MRAKQQTVAARTVIQRDWRVQAAEVVCAAAVAVAEDDIVVVCALVLAAGCAKHVGLVHLTVRVESRLGDADVAAGLVQHAQAVADAQLVGREKGRKRACVSRRGRGNGCGRGAPWPRGRGGARLPAPPRGAAFRGCARRGVRSEAQSQSQRCLAVASPAVRPAAPMRARRRARRQLCAPAAAAAVPARVAGVLRCGWARREAQTRSAGAHLAPRHPSSSYASSSAAAVRYLATWERTVATAAANCGAEARQETTSQQETRHVGLSRRRRDAPRWRALTARRGRGLRRPRARREAEPPQASRARWEAFAPERRGRMSRRCADAQPSPPRASEAGAREAARTPRTRNGADSALGGGCCSGRCTGRQRTSSSRASAS